MKCVICKHGETEPGDTTVTFTRKSFVIVIKNVPADVCKKCGEKYVSEVITKQLLEYADSSEKKGVVVNIRDYQAA